MSTATPVPETWQLTGDDARETLLHLGRRNLIRDAFQRLRSADGFSHARSLAFVAALVLVQAIIALVGLAAALGKNSASDLIVRSIKAAAPGPAGDLLTSAVTQAQQAGSSGRYTALWLGLVGAIVTGTTLMGQVERALNRLYGIEKDRPTLQKYGRALVLALTVGVLSVLRVHRARVRARSRRRPRRQRGRRRLGRVRWPLALVLMMAAMALLFRWSPRRHQPAWSWLAFGASVSVLLWTLVTLGLGLFFRVSTSFGDTYGPLAGIVALLMWALLSSVAVLFGAAVAAQLEAVRAGAPEPQDAEKIEHSEPDQRAARRDTVAP